MPSTAHIGGDGMKGNLSLLLLVFLPSILTAAPVYNPTTGHWYERVDVTASGITWTDAKAAAEARSYSGAQGYLAPITSDQENWWIVNHLGGAATLDR